MTVYLNILSHKARISVQTGPSGRRGGRRCRPGLDGQRDGEQLGDAADRHFRGCGTLPASPFARNYSQTKAGARAFKSNVHAHGQAGSARSQRCVGCPQRFLSYVWHSFRRPRARPATTHLWNQRHHLWFQGDPTVQRAPWLWCSPNSRHHLRSCSGQLRQHCSEQQRRTRCALSRPTRSRRCRS